MPKLSGKGRSERRKWHFRVSRFKNFPDPPTYATTNICTRQKKCWIRPWIKPICRVYKPTRKGHCENVYKIWGLRSSQYIYSY